MTYILCSQADEAAIWLYENIRQHIPKVELLTEELLWYNKSLNFNIDSDTAHFSCQLYDGRIFDSAAVHSIINRIKSVPSEHLKYVQETDMKYAMQESNAILLAILGVFEHHIFNPPTPTCLHGNRLHISKWHKAIADKGGLYFKPTILQHTRISTRANVLVFDQCVFGQNNQAIPSSIQQLCLQLSAWSNNPIIAFSFLLTEQGEWLFESTDLLPDFRSYLQGEQIHKVIDILAKNVTCAV